MTTLSQRDPRWADLQIGTSPYKVGPSGCLITVLAMILDTTPDIVIAYLMKAGGLTPDGEVDWGKIAEAFPGISCNRFWTYNNDDVLAHLPAIVQVDGSPIGGTIHFVLYIGNHQLIDPWDGQVKPTSTYVAQSYATISGTWQNMPQQPTDHYLVDVSGKYKIDYTNLDSLKVLFDAWVRLQNGQLIDKAQFDAQASATTTCQTQLQSATIANTNMQDQLTQQESVNATLRTTNENIQKELDQVRYSYDQETAKNSDLHEANALISKASQDIETKNYEVSQLANKRQSLIKMMADAAGITYDPTKEEEIITTIAKQVVVSRDSAKKPVDNFAQEMASFLKSWNIDGALAMLHLSPLDLNNLQSPAEQEKIKRALDEIFKFASSKEEGKEIGHVEQLVTGQLVQQQSKEGFLYRLGGYLAMLFSKPNTSIS